MVGHRRQRRSGIERHEHGKGGDLRAGERAAVDANIVNHAGKEIRRRLQTADAHGWGSVARAGRPRRARLPHAVRI